MSTLQLLYAAVGMLLLGLCGLMTAVNLYVLQPIARLRYGSAGVEKRASPAVLIGDILAAGAVAFLCLSQSTQAGRDVAVLLVLPVWLANPMALPWICIMALVYLARQLKRGPHRAEVFGSLAVVVLILFGLVAAALTLLGGWPRPG